jgi:hypothetical protein
MVEGDLDPLQVGQTWARAVLHVMDYYKGNGGHNSWESPDPWSQSASAARAPPKCYEAGGGQWGQHSDPSSSRLNTWAAPRPRPSDPATGAKPPLYPDGHRAAEQAQHTSRSLHSTPTDISHQFNLLKVQNPDLTEMVVALRLNAQGCHEYFCYNCKAWCGDDLQDHSAHLGSDKHLRNMEYCRFQKDHQSKVAQGAGAAEVGPGDGRLPLVPYITKDYVTHAELKRYMREQEEYIQQAQPPLQHTMKNYITHDELEKKGRATDQVHQAKFRDHEDKFEQVRQWGKIQDQKTDDSFVKVCSMIDGLNDKLTNKIFELQDSIDNLKQQNAALKDQIDDL